MLDLDPGAGATLAECAEVARWVRELLEGADLRRPGDERQQGHPPVRAPRRHADHGEASDGTELAQALQSRAPRPRHGDTRKAERGGKVLVDWSQNNGNKTTITPYSLRGRTHPTVAAPRTWDELADPTWRTWSSRDARPPARTWATCSPPSPTRTTGWPRRSPGPTASDKLAKYRTMRDPKKTPEPVPAAAPEPSDGQHLRHPGAPRAPPALRLPARARRRARVSWALPKGAPTDPKQNHLAVQTEDHPLEYGSFEGTIPAGEYGGGEVTIWDAGTYELEKWRDDEEVIVTLHGEQHGTRRLALIHTGGLRQRSSSGSASRAEETSWLIHLMAPRDEAHPPKRAGHGGATLRPAEPDDEPAGPALPRPSSRPPERSRR